jgi:putative membrane protein insertion efficiency factor
MIHTAMIGLLGIYKRWVSPLLPAACRFQPSCSEYAREALELHGIWRGSTLTLRRLLRCQPFCRGGFDPVPGVIEAGCRHG